MLKTLYTANFNGYDVFREPAVVTPGWNYIYFTNDKNIKSNIWDVRYVRNIRAKEARFIKIMNPACSHHDLSIWIDSSITINCNLDNFIDKYSKSDFNLLKHPNRNCVYQEAEACIKRKKDNVNVIKAQVINYRALGYPFNNGMVATGMLIRKRSKAINDFCEKWWQEVNRFSKRDQLSFNFINWKNPIPYHLIPFEVLQNEFILNKHIHKL